jgi:hypothetical protein
MTVHFIGHTDPVVFAHDVAEKLKQIDKDPNTRGTPIIKYNSCQFNDGLHFSVIIICDINEE